MYKTSAPVRILLHTMIIGFLASLFGCGDGKPGFFSSNGYHIAQEKVWYKTAVGMSYNVTEVVGADPNTFAAREFSSKFFPGRTAFYGIDQNSIYCAGYKIAGTDLPSFEYLCNNYSKDKHAIYYLSERLTDDVAHFAVVSDEFVKDAQHVYFGNGVFSEDPAHFSSVGEQGSGYYKDSKKCWYGIYELPDADAKTLRYIGPKTAADVTRLYYEMNEVSGADLQTYQILKDGYAKDAHQVYLNGYSIEDADPVTFHVVSDAYSLDARHCYYFTSPIPHADPATFQVIDRYYAKDARQVFNNGKPMEGADPATFRVLNGPAGCSCDANHAYNLEKRIEGANPKNFPVGRECKSCNESGVTF